MEWLSDRFHFHSLLQVVITVVTIFWLLEDEDAQLISHYGHIYNS